MSCDFAVRTVGLSKRFGDLWAVRDLDLEISMGSVYGFLGPNGSGKTTTMRMLTTLTKPTSGSAEIMGVDIQDRERVIGKIGYLPEQPPLFEELSGLEQLSYVSKLYGLSSDVAGERIEYYLRKLDMVDAAGRKIEGYSKGMRQKIGIIQAVIHKPEVVFLDEPTSGLDPKSARTVKDLISELSGSSETTVFLSTHILSVVDELSDKVGVLKNGDLVTEGAPEDLKKKVESGESRSLEEVFLSVTADHKEESKGR
ncbi:ABC-type multidrug transport system ATPase component [Methanonatronarchaeum thermophilum]|uniref:ABC-type multidrug transport system ATPase component n=1 Tax=Methanonatronarchaeum thermophilum TaxID=1927129 RepID=A0A1Y3GDV8_9EURY|nr:ABC transporter ATP-binding protein [Methanonatronarchaeum thermophilum]OUJ18384.1 ABC-type multidrug transport system ATPase component [Methanonatronarchaeum thermophilum]